MTDEKSIPLIEVRGLKKYYPIKGGVITHTTGHIRAVDGVSFSIPKGQTLGLVGESGCGKSTIGRQLVGLETPTAGTICYNGCDLEAIRKDKKQLRQIRTKLQMVFQDPYSSLNPRKHIFEILSQPMLYHHISTKASVEQDILKLLDMVGLPKTVLGRYPHEFSGGQRQRIAIAKALSLNPEFIVCDEPVSALDVSIQAQILNLLRELQKELDLTLLFVGHGLGAVNYVSNQIAVMYLGKIVEIGEAREVFRRPVHPYTKALLEAVPVPDTAQKDKERRLLQGEVGSNTNPPGGCRFHNRCPYATNACAQEEPLLEPMPSMESVIGAEQVHTENEHTSVTHKVACPMMLEHMQNKTNSAVPEATRSAADSTAVQNSQEAEAHG